MQWAPAADIPALTGLRIVAAAWVVIEHFRQPITALLHPVTAVSAVISSGYLGVEIFFVLSGFIISHNYATRVTTGGRAEHRRFLRLRFARLYPVHLVTFVAVAGLLGVAHVAHLRLNTPPHADPVSAGMNLALLQAVPPAHAWNSPAWSISCEAGAYLAFPLLAILLARATTSRRSLAGVISGLSFTIVAVFALNALGISSSTSYPVMWARIIGEFSAGCFLWAYWNHRVTTGKGWDLVTAGSAATVVAMTYFLRGRAPADITILPVLALAVLAVASSSGAVARLLGSRIAVFGGKISYSLYLTHFLVLMVVGKLLPWESVAASALPIRLGLLATYVLIVGGLATLTYLFVEEPCRRALRPRPNGHAAAAQPTVPAPRRPASESSPITAG